MRGRPRTVSNSDTNGNGNHTVQSVERTFDILETLALAEKPVSLSELSQTVGLHVSTAHRLLATLIERGYARQTEAGRYSIGSRLVELSNGINEQLDLRSEARPILEELAAQVEETANLSVRSGDDLVYIDQVQSRRLVRMFTRLGSSAPLYCTGAGKLFLAFVSADKFERELGRYLQTHPLLPRTPHTITTPDVLRAELERICKRGYSFDNQEMEEGVLCVAAPIFDRSHNIVAAISVSGPTSRLSDQHLTATIEPVVTAAAAISNKLGYQAKL